MRRAPFQVSVTSWIGPRTRKVIGDTRLLTGVLYKVARHQKAGRGGTVVKAWRKTQTIYPFDDQESDILV